MAILRTEPLGWLSSGVRILADGQELSLLNISLVRSRGRFILDDEEFTVEPKGFFWSGAELRRGSTVIARAEKSSPFRRRFEITSAAHRMVLESRSWTGREYRLLLGQQEVGRIRREGWTGRKMELDFPEDVPRFLQLFLAYLALAQAKREAAAASS